MAGKNGVANRLAGPAKTANYKPTAWGAALWSGPDGWGRFDLATVDQMRRDWQINQALLFKAAPLHTAEFEIDAGDSKQKAFAEETLRRFWQKSLGVALECMPYGYAGAEPLYKEENGLKFDALKPLHPRDIVPYTVGGKLKFVRVKPISVESNPDNPEEEKGGALDLPAATQNVPAKGYWTTYEPKYSQWFGRPIVMPAWWPWRLKTMPDGAMETAFKAFYKHSFLGAVVRHPDETYQDAQHQTPISAQEYAQQMGEQMKAGANVALSSRRDDSGNYVWAFEKYGGEAVGNFDQLLKYPDWLDRLIVRGMGIPDEIISHDGNTGGFSRSNIAYLAFLMMEEEILNHQLETFLDQILKPLLKLNFGPQAWCKVKPKPLMPDPQQQQGTTGQPGQQQGQQQASGGDWRPYQGPNGGHGFKNASTNQVRYGDMSFSMSGWEKYKGPLGGKGWKSTRTGKIAYQENEPGEHEHGEHNRLTELLEIGRKTQREAIERATKFATAKYQSLEKRYGRTSALAILGATIALSPIPVPGTSLIPIGLAELYHRLRAE